MEEVVEVLKGHFIGTFFLNFLLNLSASPLRFDRSETTLSFHATHETLTPTVATISTDAPLTFLFISLSEGNLLLGILFSLTVPNVYIPCSAR